MGSMNNSSPEYKACKIILFPNLNFVVLNGNDDFRVVINKEDDVQKYALQMLWSLDESPPSASAFCRHPLLHFSCECMIQTD
jgi:hypothetical protein